ncbi:glutathione S-transferase family protein [Congregibacter variabilis]|uniref:Glutathione S-transferase family protein n=1 Tax=Congregibacter variabilis TaxID=3081200 RepID=A0ABZ0I025_9GAMM|nr:glutathione S-transferase family protein [Congregibacter sp. IMCC43200]
MDESMILHHYESSPYAEKIRLMFGYTDSNWRSLISPAWPPRPNVDPLSGGYRRIPIAQLGADIFCDTALIAQEIASMRQDPSLDPYRASGPALEIMRRAESEGFFAAITSVSTLSLLGTLLRGFGPLGAYRFVKDRSGFLKGGTSKPKAAADSKDIMRDLFETLEKILATQPWIAGDAPSIADFAVYHPIWLHLSCSGNLPPAASKTLDWYERVSQFGHGHRHEITQDEAFEAARSANPRPLPASEALDSLELGQFVEIHPEDYGVVPVRGTLAAVTAERVILERKTDSFGSLHVHFPRSGYALKAATNS